jgi:XTP/dITP diphosphohydrolase
MNETIRNPQSAIRNHLLVATTNPGKIAEISALLDGLNFQIIGLSDLSQSYPPVDETGTTFIENALIKAEYYHRQTGLLTVADDSGLEVDALGGRPGVYSARYGGTDQTSLAPSEQIAKLLDELRQVPEEKRTARFVCSIALIGTGLRETFEGRCEGMIAFSPRGSGGFGYDPIFIDPELGKSFAELSQAEKAQRSHRGKALVGLRAFLEKMKSDQCTGNID